MIKISIKTFGVNFDNSKSDKKGECIIKEIHIWKSVRLCLRGTNIIDNQTLSSKLWHMGQILAIPKKDKQFPLK